MLPFLLPCVAPSVPLSLAGSKLKQTKVISDVTEPLRHERADGAEEEAFRELAGEAFVKVKPSAMVGSPAPMRVTKQKREKIEVNGNNLGLYVAC